MSNDIECDEATETWLMGSKKISTVYHLPMSRSVGREMRNGGIVFPLDS